jgi:hypothetical protein
MHFRMVTPWKGAKRIAGGESPRIGYCLAMSPGRGESLFRPMSHLLPLQGSWLLSDRTPGLRPGLFSDRPSGASPRAKPLSWRLPEATRSAGGDSPGKEKTNRNRCAVFRGVMPASFHRADYFSSLRASSSPDTGNTGPSPCRPVDPQGNWKKLPLDWSRSAVRCATPFQIPGWVRI